MNKEEYKTMPWKQIQEVLKEIGDSAKVYMEVEVRGEIFVYGGTIWVDMERNKVYYNDEMGQDDIGFSSITFIHKIPYH